MTTFLNEAELPIKGVAVLLTFTSNGSALKGMARNGELAIEKKTAKKGGFNIKTLPAGTYMVALKKPGFADQTVTISVSEGDMTVLKVRMVRC